MHLVPPLLAPLLRGGTKRGETVIVEFHNNKDHLQVTAPRLLKVLPRIMDLHLLRTQIPTARNHHHNRTVPVLPFLQGEMEIHSHTVEQDLQWLILV